MIDQAPAAGVVEALVGGGALVVRKAGQASQQPGPLATAVDGGITDLTIRIASQDELRRRAAEGDQDAISELARRGLEAEARAA